MPTESYSGYLPVTDSKSLHYVFVESFDQPATDPLLIWFNGGPGCSSMLGLFQEIGPFSVNDDDHTVTVNPEPWNKKANVLYIESPAGVGFSVANTTQDMKHNDMSVSEDAFKALQEWYVKFPEYKDNDLFVTGESYAGIYGPYLAW